MEFRIFFIFGFEIFDLIELIILGIGNINFISELLRVMMREVIFIFLFFRIYVF